MVVCGTLGQGAGGTPGDRVDGQEVSGDGQAGRGGPSRNHQADLWRNGSFLCYCSTLLIGRLDCKGEMWKVQL